MNDCIAIFGAVKEEIAGIKQAMNISDHVRLGKTSAWPGKWGKQSIVLVRSGVGRQRAEDATLQVIDRFQPKALISIGYAGAVQLDLNVGDLVIANTIIEEKEKGDLTAMAVETCTDAACCGPGFVFNNTSKKCE